MKYILHSRTENKSESTTSELLKSYRELSEEFNKLKAKNRALEEAYFNTIRINTQLSGNISHEIKTPFYGILNSVSLLKNSNNLSAEDIYNLNVIEQNSQYLITTLNDLLDFYNLENKSIKLNKVNFNLKSELEPLLNYYKVKAEEKELNFVVKFGHNIPKYLKGDTVRIKQVVHQLLSNSLKYTEKGKISINVNGYNLDYKTFDIDLIVTDTGVGIDDIQKEKIWQMFSVTRTDTSLNTGIGIGLTLVKELVYLMNGKIIVDSKKDIGSTFSITIPLELGVSDNKELYKNILLVEDNIINQKLTKAILDRQGFNVDTASNGKIGVDKYRQNNYDLVLMDIQMPVMDGYESSRLIREYEKLNPLKKPATIIAVSANSDKNNLSKLNESGINFFINKPFNIDKFSVLLSNLDPSK
jgi:signal transduction histidine kinase/ActR/RegA family two-component response regulator